MGKVPKPTNLVWKQAVMEVMAVMEVTVVSVKLAALLLPAPVTVRAHLAKMVLMVEMVS